MSRTGYIFSSPEINDKVLLNLYLTTYFLGSSLKKITGLTLSIKEYLLNGDPQERVLNWSGPYFT